MKIKRLLKKEMKSFKKEIKKEKPHEYVNINDWENETEVNFIVDYFNKRRGLKKKEISFLESIGYSKEYLKTLLDVNEIPIIKNFS